MKLDRKEHAIAAVDDDASSLFVDAPFDIEAHEMQELDLDPENADHRAAYEQIRADLPEGGDVVEMQQQGLDPFSPEDRKQYARIRADAVKTAAEMPPELLAKLGQMVEAQNVSEVEIELWQFDPRRPDQRTADEVNEAQVPAEVVRAVGRAVVAADELAAEAKRHPGYLRTLEVRHRSWRLRLRVARLRSLVTRRVGERRQPRRRPNVRSGPRKSRAPDEPEPDDEHDDAVAPARSRAGFRIWSAA